MFHTCVRSFEQIDDNASETGVVVLLISKQRAPLRKTAEDFIRKECEELWRTSDQRNLDNAHEEELIRKVLEEEITKLSPEERRKWIERLVAKLGLQSVIMDRYPLKPSAEEEPK